MVNRWHGRPARLRDHGGRNLSASGWIGVDFDGTLAEYHGYVPGGRFGDPIPVMMERVRAWLAEGVIVKIMTARAADPDEAVKVQDWCERHGLPRLIVTDRKDFSMIELWDDRAVTVQFNTGVCLTPRRV